jgi:arginine decarboxylase
MKPLDSLFSPRGTLRQALDLAARAFRADRSMFVTNGTTGANAIVYRTLLAPGDTVLVDRNCHKSHHYAVLQSGAHVAYMEPEHVNRYGISSLVTLDTILSTVRRYKGAAKMLALTHPTFDGLCYDPYRIIESVHQIDPEIVFLFDEAWFAYGVFHPEFRDRSAMVAAKKLRANGVEAAVYVTQSIHKTLSAMRQASMIHVHDDDAMRARALDEAVEAHVTTSPNVHLLASLDVARMQAEMEGFDRLKDAHEIATWIRSEFSTGHIRALEMVDLTTDRLTTFNEATLDPLKITLYVDGISGARFREDVLYGQFGIQTNKYSLNTVLILVTIGTTWSMADHLVRSLKQWVSHQRCVATLPAEGIAIPPFSGFDKRYSGSSEGTGDIGKAYFSGRDASRSESTEITKSIGRVSANFVTPYPPGYPILVPGQVISAAVVQFIEGLQCMGAGEIHGISDSGQLFVFKEARGK